MTLQFEETQDSVIVSIATAKILDESQIVEIGDKLMDACGRAATAGKRLVIDFRGVDFMSSAMLGKLVLLNKAAKSDDLVMRMANVGENVLEVFQICHLDKIFDFRDDTDGPDHLGAPVSRPRRPSSDSGHADSPPS